MTNYDEFKRDTPVRLKEAIDALGDVAVLAEGAFPHLSEQDSGPVRDAYVQMISALVEANQRAWDASHEFKQLLRHVANASTPGGGGDQVWVLKFTMGGAA